MCIASGSVHSAWQLQGVSLSIPTNENLDREKRHPYLIINQDEITKIKDLVNRDLGYRYAYDLLRKSAAEGYINTLTTPGYGTNDLNEMIYIKEMALWYVLSGDDSYATAANDTLLNVASKYKGNIGTIHHQTLNISIMLVRYAVAYDLLFNDLSDDDRLTMEQFMLDVVQYIQSRPRGMSNWQTWHNAAIGTVGFVLQNKSLYTSAIWGDQAGLSAFANNEFSDTLNYGFVSHLSQGLLADGIWYEQSYDYHNFTLHSLTWLAEVAYRYGYDLFQLDVNGKSLKFALDSQFYHSYSNMQQPLYADGNPYPLNGNLFIWNFAYGFKHYGESKYKWLWDRTTPRSIGTYVPYLLMLFAIDHSDHHATKEEFGIGTGLFAKSGINILGSSLFPNTGMGVLRGSVLKGNPLNISFIYKPQGKIAGHQHADNLGIEVVSGRSLHRWIPNSKNIAGYGHILNSGYLQHTISRNTMVVDMRSQKPQALQNKLIYPPFPEEEQGNGALVSFAVSPLFSFMKAESDELYDSVSLQRRIINTDTYALDIFSGESDESRIYDWPIRIDGELVFSSQVLRSGGSHVEDNSDRPAVNWIQNPGFELDENGRVADWRVHHSWSPDLESKHQGINSMKTSGRWHTLQQTVGIVGGRSYQLRLTVKKEGPGSGRITFSSQGHTLASIDFTPTNEWGVFSEKVTIPDGITEVEVTIMNANSQTLWVDEVVLENLSQEFDGLGHRAGYQFVTNVQEVISDENWETEWMYGQEVLKVTTLAEPGSRFMMARAPKSESDYWPLVVVRRESQSSAFVTLLESYLSGESPVVQQVERLNEGGTQSDTLRVTMRDAVDYISWHKRVTENVVSDVEYRGKASLFRVKNGVISDLLLVHGDFIKAGTASLEVVGGVANVGWSMLSDTLSVLSYGSGEAFTVSISTEAADHCLTVATLDGDGQLLDRVETRRVGKAFLFKATPYTNYAVLRGKETLEDLISLKKYF